MNWILEGRSLYSARKPYLKLKMSIGEFFKSRVVFMKQLHMKFSEFEKPYLESEYNQMHLEIPTPDWPSWQPRALPPLGGLGPFDPPSVPRQTGPFPQDKDDDWKFLGCEMYIFPTSVEPGGSYTIKFARGDDPIVSISIEGPGSITASSLPGCTGDAGGLCTIYLYMYEDVGDWEWITITPTTATGRTCGRVAMIEAACDPTAVIQYTTLQMAVDEAQTLTASIEGEDYDWAISSGGGSLSVAIGNSTVYTAPSSNDATCSQNSTITLSCDGVVIDSITIAVNKWTGDEDAYKVWENYYSVVTCPSTYEYTTSPSCPCNLVGGSLICCPSYYGAVGHYRCDGVWNSEDLLCSKNSYGVVANCGVCDTRCPPLISDCDTCMASLGYTMDTSIDLRTQAMKDGGCCPEGLL